MRRLLFVLSFLAAAPILAADPEVMLLRSNNLQFVAQFPPQYRYESVWVMVRTADPAAEAFAVTLEYTDSAGRKLARTQAVQRIRYEGAEARDTWTAAIFSFQVGTLAKVRAVRVVSLQPRQSSGFTVGDDGLSLRPEN